MNDFLDKFNEIISKYIKKDKINHAYLLETNFVEKQLLINEIINKIISYENNITLEQMKVNGDLIIIDGTNCNIKTEEIENIKEKFKTKSLLNSKRIYVINGAEKLNNYAANKLLKFLEEPEDNIISILVTDNINNVMNTIVSRCFNIRFFVKTEFNFETEYLDKLFDFVKNIEDNNEQAIAFQNKLYYNDLSDRVYLNKFLNDLLLIYDDVIQYKINNSVKSFENQIDIIKKISDNNDINIINRKINAISDSIDKLVYNPNVKLLIDKLIIEMSGVDSNA